MRAAIIDVRRHPWPLALVLVVTVALFWGASWEADRLEGERLEMFRGDVDDMAELAHTVIRNRLDAYDGGLLQLRAVYVADPSKFDRRLKRLRTGILADPDLLVGVVDRAGQVTYTDAPGATPRQDLHDAKFFRFFADDPRDRLYADGPLFGRVTRRHTLPLARPVYDRTGAFVGVIALSVLQSSLGNFGPRLRLRGDTAVSIVTESGAVVTRSTDLAAVQGTTIPADRLAKFQGSMGVFTDQAIGGVGERIVAFRRLEGAPLIVYVSESPQHVLDAAQQQRVVLLSGAAALSVLTLLLIAIYVQRQQLTRRFIATQQAHLVEAQRIANMASWELDLLTREFKFSERVYPLFGMVGQRSGSSLECLLLKVFEPDRTSLQTVIGQIVEAGSGDFEFRFQRGDGQQRFMSGRGEAVRGDFGTVTGLIGTVRDVTQGKNIEVELLLQSQRSEVLLQLPAAADVRDENAFMQYALEMAEQLTGSQVSFIHFVHDDQETIELVTWSRATLEHYCTAISNKHLPISQSGIWADALRQRAPVLFNDYPNASGKHGLPDGHARLERLISVPVIEAGLVRMMMGVGNKPQGYTEFDVETARLIADAVWRIVHERRAHADMRRSRQALEEAQAIAGVGSYVLDMSNGLWESSPELDRLFGIDAAYERTVPGWEALVHPDERAMMDEYFYNQVVGRHKTFDKEYRIRRHSDQVTRWVHGLGRLEFDEQGGLRRMVGTIRDLTDREQARRASRESEERYRTLVEWTPEPIGVHRDGKLIYANPAAVAMFGAKSVDELLGKPILELVHPDFHQLVLSRVKAQVENRQSLPMAEEKFLRLDGTPIDVEVQSRPIMYDGQTAIQVAMRDITAHKAAQEQIQTLAYSDPVTGLPNRRLLMDRLQQALTASTRHQRKGAVLMVDLDNFKNLNESHGHDAGDLLLKQVGRCLVQCVREGDTVARVGGDEFIVLLAGLSQDQVQAANQAEALSEKILAALNQGYQLPSQTHHNSASIGVTLFGGRHEGAEEPVKRAELAMYQAKAAGRNTLRFFDPQMQAAVTARAALEASLRQALQGNEFRLYYQAQVTDTGQISGVEGLLRWQDPRRGLIAPGEFIPLAEESGFILPLGDWVLEAACKQLALWSNQAEFAHLTISVNVSARQFRLGDFVEQVLATLERTGAQAQRLKLELTESMLVSDVEDVIGKMNALKGRGISFSLDDFGTGYSSLSYLKRLPLDQLKIDQGFVRDILIDPNDAAIARMVVVLADTLGLEVMAEGVETQAQRDFLAKLGCRNYQGYLFSRPVPVAELEALVKRT